MKYTILKKLVESITRYTNNFTSFIVNLLITFLLSIFL